jgi:RNA polymerase sigma-B factor
VSPRHLFERYRATGDPQARRALVARFMPLARHLARRYERSSEPFDDLVQVASVGLLKAIDRFDPDQGTAFSSFAVPTILGELRRHFRDRGWAIRVPRDVQERVAAVERITDDLRAQLRRAPTPAEVAAAIGATSEEVVEALEASAMYRVASLDEPTDEYGDELVASVGVEDDAFAQTETAVAVEPLLWALTARQRRVLHLRFHEDLTQEEIGARLGVSQMQVSRLLRTTLEELRDAAESYV